MQRRQARTGSAGRRWFNEFVSGLGVEALGFRDAGFRTWRGRRKGSLRGGCRARAAW